MTMTESPNVGAKEHDLTIIISKLENINGRISGHNERKQMIIERLYGTSPDSGQTTPERPIAGDLDRINGLLEMINEHLDNASSQLDRLAQL